MSREIVDGLTEAGYLEPRSGMILNPDGAYWWLHANGYSAAQSDAALGLRMGTTMAYGEARGYPTLTGFTGRNRTLPPPSSSPYGSGYQGTQAPAAPAAAPNVAPPPAQPETTDQRRARWTAHNDAARWSWPDDELAIRNDAARLGFDPDEVVEWMTS